MAMTKTAADQLGAKVVGHDDLGPAVKLPNGMYKTARGLIAPPSTDVDGTRSGVLVVDDEQEQPATPEPVEQVQPTTRRKRAATKKQVDVGTKAVTVTVTLAGFGSVPTQYAHVYVGDGVLVLGLNGMSFAPEETASTDTGLTNMVSFSVDPGSYYVYCGNKFTDKDGVVNMILAKVQN